MRVRADFLPAEKFDVYVDEKKEVEGSPFRGGTADEDTLTRIWINTSSGPSVTAFFDDIFAYDKTGPDPHAVHSSGKLPLTWGRIKFGYPESRTTGQPESRQKKVHK